MIEAGSQNKDEKEKKQFEENDEPANNEDLDTWQRAEVTAANINDKDANLPGKMNHKLYVIYTVIECALCSLVVFLLACYILFLY